MSYDANLTTPKDEVRFILQDTDQNDEMLLDAEISAVLTKKNDDVDRAALYCCEVLATRYAYQADKIDMEDDTAITMKERSARILNIANMLRSRITASGSGGNGGILVEYTSINDIEDSLFSDVIHD